MLIESTSQYLLKKTRAKAKMIEYSVPKEQHIAVEQDVEKLFLIAVAAIGDICTAILKNIEDCDTIIDSAKEDLEFSSKYFDSYLNTQLDEGSDDYYLLLGSIAYYLCDYIGSSKVLINRISAQEIDLSANGIEKALVALLQDSFQDYEVISTDETYKEYLNLLQKDLNSYYKTGNYPDIQNIYSLRTNIYRHGSDIELLLGDAFSAIYILKMRHSAINLLPNYMNLKEDVLHGLLFQSDAIKELWPSQRQLGESGIFAGLSAVVQMPTSSGKTKSISLVIASAFLSERTRLAVIVAPFRALCREISTDLEQDFNFNDTFHVDELSDILQREELGIDSYDENQKTVLIATPEKLIYLLRQRNDLINQIGLIVFDEGHLFDEPNRGIIYELLISTIKNLLQDDVQKVLISAIIPNAAELNDWINNSLGAVISDNTIKSTQKTIAITDWNKSEKKHYGYLYFVNPENPDEEEFYVPRLIPIVGLNKKNRERKTRIFPEVDFKKSKVMHNDIAIYYGLTLCHNGGVGIFCGRKDSANDILKRILEIESRGYAIDSLLKSSDETEVISICKLIEDNYGSDNIYYLAGNKAAFAHHAGISNGIKISIEHAMKIGKVKFIVCTSTLAQGVNLPIRYLVISNMYQGKDQIRVRDFHNLIGRAGRSGIFTEGSILLTESFIYNNRNKSYLPAQWKWQEYKRFINNKNSEPCSSKILFLVKPCLVVSV
ncbi:MAG: DEAD/DEAH box helicase [Clostridiaceae bacterium]|nr:DEAD/DEAH box helicase [Clostridiaceae bacterium]